MIVSRSIIFLVFFFLQCTIYVRAQQPFLRHYDVDDGLPGSHVYQILQDKHGFIWISTDQGIARFDGYEFTHFTVDDGLPSNDIWNIAEDEEGRIWLGTFNEMVYIKDEQIGSVDLPPGIEGTPMIIHAIDSLCLHAIIFKQPNKKYYLWDKKQNTVEIAEDHFYYMSQGPIVFTPDNSTWPFLKRHQQHKIGNGPFACYIKSNLHYYNWDINQFIKSVESPINIEPIGEDTVYIFNSRGIHMKNSLSSQLIPYSFFFPGNVQLKSVIRLDKTRMLLISGNQCVVVNNQLEIVNGYDFLNDIRVHYTNYDRQGNLWISSSSGLYFLGKNAKASQTFHHDASLKGDDITSLAISERNQVLMGSRTGRLYTYDQQAGFQQQLSQTLRTETIRKMLYWPGQYLCLGGDELIIIPISPTGSLINQQAKWYRFIGNIKAMSLSQDHALWAASFDAIRKFRPHPDLGFEKARIINGRSYALARDGNQWWIGRKNGLWFHQNGKTTRLAERHPIFSSPINDLILDINGYLWIATDGFGFYRYDGETQLDTIQELNDLLVKSIFVDQQNQVWVATNQGAKMIRTERQQPFTYQINTIDKTHGLPSIEVNEVASVDGMVVVASKKGITLLDERQFTKDTSILNLWLYHVEVNGKMLPKQTRYELGEGDQDFKISYVGLDYQADQRIEYHYRLHPFDQDWKTTQKLELSYPYLPPGNYTFELKASDQRQDRRSKTLSLQITVTPAWYKTWQGWLAIILGFGLASWAYFQQRVNRTRRVALEQAKLDRKLASLELSALQAQMNPHFIFNALQSIQDFIFNKDEREANRYIVKFSRLMRLFLESSKEKEIILTDEIMLIRLYVELEHLRFTDKFDYSIEVAPEVKPDSLVIPSMIIQPFVENAINRGLVNRKSKGFLKICFTLNNPYLEIQIEDNGIGRAAAEQLKRTSLKEHKSRGMQPVKERKNLLNLMEKTNISIDIIDLKNEQGEATGTRVLIGMKGHEEVKVY